MALEIRRGAPPVGITADRRLYLTADGLVVEAGDAGAASLLATPGWVIPAEDVTRLGLTVMDGRVVQSPAIVVVGESGEVKPKAKRRKAG